MKNIILLVITSYAFISCKLPGIAFTEGSMDMAYVKHLAVVAGGFRGNNSTDPQNKITEPEDTTYIQMRLYASVLRQALTVRNRLVEETIMNNEHPDRDKIEPMQGTEFRLYMAVMGDRAGGLCVYMPAIIDAAGICLRMGPAWIGTWNAGEFSFYKTLQHRADRNGGPGKWYYDRRENEDRRTGSIMLHGENSALRKLTVRMVTDRKENIASIDSFRILRVFRRSPSQIGADKGIMFDIPEIFQDSSALLFRRILPDTSIR
jgi:hypothetical protein